MKAILPTFQPENRFWLSGAPKQDFYLYFELKGAQAPADDKRVPLNISLVLDRSGSMAGDKVAYVKKAAQFVIDNLASDDFLSIVQYDDQIDVVSPSAKVVHKGELRQRVEQITARNMTNLSGGMLAGYEQVQSTKQDKYVNRVLLLTDGLANVGITQPEQLNQLVQQKFRELGVALSAFGVGADYNEVLLTNLAEYGGANYYFIDSPDKIPGIFAEELRGLLAVVAQNAKLEIRFPAEYFRCEKVFGFPAEKEHGAVRVHFNDLFSEEKKAILLKFSAVRPIDKDLDFAATLRYDNALGGFAHVEETFHTRLSLTQKEADVLEGVQSAVIEQTALFVANDLFEDAVRLADRRDFEGAKKLIAQVKMFLEKHFQTMPPSEELSRQYKEVLRYEAQLQEMDQMTQMDMLMAQKSSRMSSYELRKKKPF